MIEHRKAAHIDICSEKDVQMGTNAFENVELVHRALPEVDMDAIDLKINFLGANFDLPFMICAMTG
jgi:isopentenyl-diphosphate delta-isomerase